MKNTSKSPFLIALITFSMIASSVGSSSAYGATTPAQEQAAAKARAEAEAKAKAEAERARAQAEAQQRAQQQAQAEAQRKAQAEAQQRAQQQAQQQAQQEAQRRAQAEAQAKAQQDQAKAQQEAQRRAQADAQAKAQQDQAKAQQEAQRRAQADAQAKAQQDQAKAQQEAQRRAQADAQAKAQQDQAKAQQEAQRKAQADAQAKAQQDQAKAQEEAQRKAQADAQAKAQQDQAKAQADAKAKVDAENKTRGDAQRKAQEEAQRKAQADAQAKAQQDQAKAQADAKAKVDAENKTRGDAQRKAQEEAQRKAQADAQAKAQQDQAKAQADAKAKVDAENKTRGDAQRKAQEEAQRKAQADAQAKAQQDAKSKAEQSTRDKAAADKARADRASRDAQEKANRRPPPQNPVGPPPIVVVKQEDKASVADKLKATQQQTAQQAAQQRAQRDQESQRIAQQAAQKSADPRVLAEQKAKEAAAQQAAGQKAKEIAQQKAQERKAIQTQAPVVVKTPQQAQAEAQKQVQERAKAKERIAVPTKTAEVKKEKETKAAEVEVATVQKKEVVAVKRQEAIIVKQNVDIKKMSQNPNQVTPAQAKIIEQNKKQIQTREARNQNKPVVAAPVHSAPVVELKVVNGHRIGLDPNRPVKVVVPVKVIVKPVIVVGGVQVPSHMAFRETQENIHSANIRSETIHNTIINRTDVKSVTIVKNITKVTNVYVNNYQNVVIERSRVYNNYYYEPKQTYRQYYSSYYDHGFRGGYAYPVRVDVAIHEHFWNPLVLWMFDDSDNREFYCQYYGESYCYSYPIRPFRYARVFYPTDTMRDLAIEVSGMAYYRHTYYRTALEVLTDKLNAQISNYVSGRFNFGPNDVVINHYRNLGGGQVVVEGFVDRGSLHVAFKGRLDLENPYNSDVFVPTVSDYSPAATGIAILNAIVALEQAADVRDHVDANVVYEEPAPPPLPISNVTCSTFSGDFKGTGIAPDSGTASQSAIDQCSAQNGANATECTSNLSCDDGVSYAPVVSCSTSSTDANGNVVSFIRNGRDADYASQMAQELCVADDSTNDVDACSSPDNVTCVALDNSILNPMACSVQVPTVSKAFSFQSYDSDKARTRAISSCVTADGTDVDDCNDTDNLSCDYVNAPAPVAPAPSCTASGPSGQTYESGPASDLRSAYNIAVKACTRANPSSFGICESTAIANCPGAKN